MLKVGIIGCGKIADSHVSQIRRIANCEIVGVCDKEILMAKQLCERFEIEQYFENSVTMIKETRPDVVHITTPPGSHFNLTKLCLDMNCHVYVEKPFTLNTDEAKILLKLAEEKNLKVTVGHDQAFNHAERRMRELIKRGYIGGPPIHIESYYCYDLGDTYAKALTGDKKHWVRKLPGKLLHNIINHGICFIAEHFRENNPDVIVCGFTSPLLKNLKEEEIIDELRVIIKEKDNITAYFTFSSQIKPVLHQYRIYGPKNSIIVDDNNQTCIKVSGKKYKSYLDMFYPPILYALQFVSNALKNIKLFLGNDFHMKSGMKYLIEEFYKSISNSTTPPIPYREIILTTQIMENIFNQLYQNEKANPNNVRIEHQ